MKKVKHFMVVDDDPAARYLSTVAIEDMGIAQEIVSCKNGAEALKFIINNCLPTEQNPDIHCPELILLDLNMPVMDGYEFLTELAKLEDLQHNNTSVILTSSADYKSQRKNIERFSILGYIEKPVVADKLLRLLTDTNQPA